MRRTLVIIPTYNEKENIEAMIDAVLKAAPVDLLIVDDNSPDKTYEIVEKVMKTNTRVLLLKRAGKLGLGTAYVEGFKLGLAKGYEAMMEMDADFSHDPGDIPRFLEAIDDADLVIGSRYVQGVSVINWPLRRLLLSYFASRYVEIITGMPVRDATGGFKCFRREVLESINLDKVVSNGYSFQIEMNHRCWKKGFKIQEIPIIFKDRFQGKTKMSKAIIREAIWVVWKLRLGLIR